ncbi:hypothetical protein HDU93_005588 [Gonapodya sp. JEL0774]|nr:hypothetical protein HDU93_005588 [Gonapodya sp. JEL0774]
MREELDRCFAQKLPRLQKNQLQEVVRRLGGKRTGNKPDLTSRIKNKLFELARPETQVQFRRGLQYIDDVAADFGRRFVSVDTGSTANRTRGLAEDARGMWWLGYEECGIEQDVSSEMHISKRLSWGLKALVRRNRGLFRILEIYLPMTDFGTLHKR